MGGEIQLTRAERTGFLVAVLLSASAGAVDIIAFLLFNHVFVANMSGNTVLFASALVAAQYSEAVTHFLPIVTFVAGIVTARLTLVQIKGLSWSGTGLCLILVSGLWIIAAVLIPNLNGVLIPVLAFSMGAQNTTLTQLDKIPVNTAFITGNLEKLGEALASLFRRPSDRDERLKLWTVGSIWIAYACGAALGAFAALNIGRHSLLLPATILCLSAVLVFASRSSGARLKKD
jgi:uncharacterized membrane protein YoaK (UPF0700 family)